MEIGHQLLVNEQLQLDANYFVVFSALSKLSSPRSLSKFSSIFS